MDKAFLILPLAFVSSSLFLSSLVMCLSRVVSGMIGIPRCDTPFRVQTELLCVDMASDSLAHEAAEQSDDIAPSGSVGIQYDV